MTARERELDECLRRADWRFLLPSPRPGRVLCRATGPLARALASIAREVVDAGDGCDLAVAEDPDAATLAELYDSLRPGGVCYTEWRATPGGHARILRALSRAGFVEVTCYRRWPAGAPRPVYWIPLGSPGASAYVRGRRRLRGGRLRRVAAGARDWASALVRGRLPGSLCVVARRPGEIPTDDLAPAAWLRSTWPSGQLGPVPERLSTLLVTGGPRSVSKVVLLAFAEPSPRPLVALKAARVEGAVPGVRREGAVLGRIARQEGAMQGGATRGIPRLLFVRDLDGLPLVGETALAGTPLDAVLTPRNLERWAAGVTGWLADLAQPSRGIRQSCEHVVEPALTRFAELFSAAVDAGMLRETEALVRGIGPLPRVPEQRDFGPWNLLVTPERDLAVLDWESAEADGLPALDLLYFLAYASFHVDRARDREGRLAAHRRSLDPLSRTGAVRRECLARYLGALGLGEDVLAPLRALVWLIHAPSEYRHAAADAGGEPPAEALARGLFLGLWAEELRDLSRRRGARAGR